MSTATANALEIPTRPPMAERYGGVFITVFFHLMLLTMAQQCILPPVPEEPNIPPPVIHFSFSPPPEPASLLTPPPLEEETSDTPPPPIPEEVRRTSDVGEQMDDIARTMTGAPMPQEAMENTAPEQEILTDASANAPEELPESDEGERLFNEALEELLSEQIEIAQADIRSQVVERAEIHGNLFQEQEELNTSNAEYSSDGLLEGSVVEIDTTGVPFIIAQRVFQRYGARLERRMITAEDAAQNQGPSTINAVTLEDGQRLTHTRQIQQGPGEVLVFGAELTTFLHLLQRERLMSLGVNPAQVAITRCVFGFERDDASGWSIVIRDFEYVEVE